MIQEDKDLLLFSTTGASMFPFIRWDEQILIKKVPYEGMAVGDVVLFQSDNGAKLCHRVVKIEDRNGILWFQTKGDRNAFYDEPVRDDAVLGRVVAIRRRMRLIRLYNAGWRALLYNIDCFLNMVRYHVKDSLARIILFLRRYRLYRKISQLILCRNISFSILREEDRYKFAASKENKIISHAYLTYSERQPYAGWWMWSLEVRFLYRRLGIGRQLIKNITDFVKRKDGGTLYLNVSKENLPALGLYERLGFNVIGDTKSIAKRQFVYMRMDLDGHRE